MGVKGATKVGRFAVDFVVRNQRDVELSDEGKLDPTKVRRATISGVVDSGANRLVLPQTVAKQLGLKVIGKTEVRYANGQTATRDIVGVARVTLLGREGFFSAVVEPKRRNALIGAIVLEELDFLVDCTHLKLVPRDPRMPISEIE
jgi:predicted aspartyl protease